MKICKYCGKSFEPATNRSVYCSPECKKHGAYHQRRKWRAATGYNEKQRVANAERRKSRSGSGDLPEEPKKKERNVDITESIAYKRGLII